MLKGQERTQKTICFNYNINALLLRFLQKHLGIVVIKLHFVGKCSLMWKKMKINME